MVEYERTKIAEMGGFRQYAVEYSHNDGTSSRYVFRAVDDQIAKRLALGFAKQRTEDGDPTTLFTLDELRTEWRSISLDDRVGAEASGSAYHFHPLSKNIV